MHGNKVKGLINRALGPAYVVMIASLVVRSLAAVMSTAIPYDTWPAWVRILVEVFAVVGMVVCSEIILSAAASSWGVLRNQLKAVEASEEYKPSPRLKGDGLRQQVAILDARKTAALAHVRGEMRTEVYAMLFGGVVSTLYGILFALASIGSTTPAAVVTDVVLCASLPFVVFYISALYKPEHKDPAETAQAAAVAALDKQVADAGSRILKGDYDRRHTNLLDAAIPDSPIHKRMIAALAPTDTSVQELSVSEVYKWFDVRDASGKASMRRVIRRAGEKKLTDDEGRPLVRWDVKEDEWRVRKSSLAYLFPPERWRVSDPNTGEHGANTPRTPPEQGASTGRTLHLPRGNTLAKEMPAEPATLN